LLQFVCVIEFYTRFRNLVFPSFWD